MNIQFKSEASYYKNYDNLIPDLSSVAVNVDFFFFFILILFMHHGTKWGNFRFRVNR